jgi:hypothetical protein
MQANDWTQAANHLAPGCRIDWPCTGEQIVGRSNFASIQASYPTNTGRWSFELHRLIADADMVVSEVTVSDGEQSARLVAFSEVNDGRISHQVEYWPVPYEPMRGREHLTRPIERIP